LVKKLHTFLLQKAPQDILYNFLIYQLKKLLAFHFLFF